MSINRQPVASADDVRALQAKLKPGDAVAFRILRPLPGGRDRRAQPQHSIPVSTWLARCPRNKSHGCSPTRQTSEGEQPCPTFYSWLEPGGCRRRRSRRKPGRRSAIPFGTTPDGRRHTHHSAGGEWQVFTCSVPPIIASFASGRRPWQSEVEGVANVVNKISTQPPTEEAGPILSTHEPGANNSGSTQRS